MILSLGACHDFVDVWGHIFVLFYLNRPIMNQVEEVVHHVFGEGGNCGRRILEFFKQKDHFLNNKVSCTGNFEREL